MSTRWTMQMQLFATEADSSGGNGLRFNYTNSCWANTTQRPLNVSSLSNFSSATKEDIVLIAPQVRWIDVKQWVIFYPVFHLSPKDLNLTGNLFDPLRLSRNRRAAKQMYAGLCNLCIYVCIVASLFLLCFFVFLLYVLVLLLVSSSSSSSSTLPVFLRIRLYLQQIPPPLLKIGIGLFLGVLEDFGMFINV